MNMMKNFFFGNQTRIGDWIAARREEMEMTQEDLAAELPIAASTLGSIENGEIGTPSQPVLEALADAFDVDVSTVEGLLNEGAEPADMVAENRKFIEEGSQANDNDCNCEETMDNRQQLVTDIVSNSDWEEDELEGFSDDHVEKLSNTVETAEADEAEADEQEADTETASADDSGQADEDIRSVVREEVSDVLEEQLENNEALGQVQNALDDKREHYIKTIVSNSSFDEDELRDDSTERLRKTAREVTDNDYSLNNPSRPTANEDSSGAPARPNIVRNSEED
jgi:transcriptional regulator with XRE-family HTH domain